MNTIELILVTAIIFGPAGIANATAAMSRHIPYTNWLAFRLDFGIEIGGKPLLGKNKTFRGLIFAAFVGMISAILIQIAYENINFVNSRLDFSEFGFNYDEVNVALFGFLIGFGALVGDAVESFFKRRIGIKSGETWLFFDQTDYIFGSILFSLILVTLNFEVYLTYIFIFFFLHLIVKYIGFKLGLDKAPI